MQHENSSSEAFESAFDSQKPQTFTTMQGVGFFVFAFTVMIPTAWYISADFHGRFENPRLALLCMLSLGGAATMSIMVGKGRRLLSILPGLLMGAGAAGMVIAANTWLNDLVHFPKIGKAVVVFAVGMGTLPGLLLWMRLTIKRKPSESSPET